MRILFAGTAPVAVPVLDALMAAGHEIVTVVSQPAARAGRGKNERPSAVAVAAEQRNLRLVTPPNINDASIVDELHELNVDVAVVVAYGQILKKPLLETSSWFNVHFSLLPQWRGAAPVQRAIMAGDQVTGVTVFQLDEGMDSGPVLGYVSTDIRAHETADELLTRLAHDGAVLMVEVLGGLAVGKIRPVAQNQEGVSYAAKLSPDDARIRWSHPALVIERQIRGCTSQPGAWTEFDGIRIGISPTKLRDDLEHLPPGHLSVVDKKVVVGTGSFPLELTEVKPAGKGWMPADAWTRGLRKEVVFS